MPEPCHDPCADGERGGMAVGIDWPYWGCNAVEAGSHGHGRRLVGNHGSCLRYSYRCARTAKTRGASVELEGVSWVEEACSRGGTLCALENATNKI